MAMPDYDMMDDMEEMPEEEESTGSDLDAELLMHAEGAGMSPEQAESLKLFVERCVQLKNEGDYSEDAEELE